MLEQLIKSYLPMSEASFLVLSSLRKETHGYGIMQDVSRVTGGRVTLGAGTVYTILYKMEKDKLISVVREEERRKVYLITSIGEVVLEEEAKRIKQLADVADSILDKYVAML